VSIEEIKSGTIDLSPAVKAAIPEVIEAINTVLREESFGEIEDRHAGT
jgi:hypothetical protein